VIPARLRQLLGLQAGDRRALSLEANGLRLIPQDRAKTSSARSLIGCRGYRWADPTIVPVQSDEAAACLRLSLISTVKARLATLAQEVGPEQVVHISRHGKAVAPLLSKQAYATLHQLQPSKTVGTFIEQ